MYAIRVNENTTSQVQIRTPPVRSDSDLAGFFIGDSIMKRIPLTQGKFAIVDDEDYEWLMQWKWHANKIGHTCYARRRAIKNGKVTYIYMHREIAKTPKNLQADHVNGNGSDNRKFNIRNCTHQQNLQNMQTSTGTSQYKGVTWYKRDKTWQAEIRQNSKGIFLGRFSTEIEAAKAYNKKAKELFGEYANPNIIKE